MRRLVPLLLLALAACGDGTTVTPRASDSPSPSASPHTYAPDALVLRVTHEGGLMNTVHVNPVPYFSLYGDGRIVTVGPEPAIHPGPAMPNVVVTRVSPDAVQWFAASARAAGVDGQERDYGNPLVSDAASTKFVLDDAHGTAEQSAYALGVAEDSPGLTAEQKAERKRLNAFYRLLTDPGKWKGTQTEEGLYEPTAIAVRAWPYDAPDPKPDEIAWRGPDPAAGRELRGVRCTVVSGDALATVLPDLRRATTITRWTYEGKAWSFVLRPLLPDEKECA